MFILDVLDICKNITFLKVFMYIQILLKLIFIIVPIGLIIMISIDFAKNVLANDDSDITKNKKIAIQRIITAIFLFAVPYIVSTFMSIMKGIDSSWYSCYENLGELTKENINAIAVINAEDLMMDLLSKEEITSNDLRTMDRYIGYIEDDSLKSKYEGQAKVVRDKYDKQLEEIANKYKNNKPKPNLTPVKPSGNSTGDGSILLVAGHSYPPYCNTANDCRGMEPSGYAEENETRKLIIKIKEKLLNEGFSNNDVDIANELLGEDMTNSENTSKSLFTERVGRTDIYNSIDWSKYSYAVEIHFNAYNTRVTGIETLSLTCSGNYNTKEIDSNYRSEISKLLGSSNRGCVARNRKNGNGIATISMFDEFNVPFSYIEVEFYDNKTAMDKYESHIDEVASIIAKNIKKYYS